MPIRVLRWFERIAWPQAVVLVAFLASVVAALALTPMALIEKAAQADWKAIGAVVIGVLTALGGIVGGPLVKSRGDDLDEPMRRRRKPWEVDGYDDEDPTGPQSPRALERRDRPPGDSSRPRSRRDGSAPVAAMVALAFVGLVALGALLSGCGGSPVAQQYQALRVVAGVYDVATDGAEAALNTQAAACDGADACLDELGRGWHPVRVAQGGVLLALQGWASVIALWEAAGDLAALARAAVRQLESVSLAWNAWAAAGRAVGWTLPPLPGEALTIIGAVGAATGGR